MPGSKLEASNRVCCCFGRLFMADTRIRRLALDSITERRAVCTRTTTPPPKDESPYLHRMAQWIRQIRSESYDHRIPVAEPLWACKNKKGARLTRFGRLSPFVCLHNTASGRPGLRQHKRNRCMFCSRSFRRTCDATVPLRSHTIIFEYFPPPAQS